MVLSLTMGPGKGGNMNERSPLFGRPKRSAHACLRPGCATLRTGEGRALVRLFAISDLHVASQATRDAIGEVPEHPDDWLILAGDIGETIPHLEWTLRMLRPRFRQLIWVPGNHDLWTLPSDPNQVRGEGRYRQLVDVCQALGGLTPEDPYPEWTAG